VSSQVPETEALRLIVMGLMLGAGLIRRNR